MHRYLALALLAPSVAWAAPPDSANTTTNLEPCEIVGAQALAAAKGIALKDLPGIDKTTELSVRFRDGVVTRASVTHSSGNDELDEVFRRCKRQETSDKDATFTGTFAYAWQSALLDGHGSQTKPHPIGPTHACRRDDMDEAIGRWHEGATGLAFDVSASGGVDNLVIASSSGYLELDLAAAKCVAKWHYEPARRSNAAVAVSWDAQVSWALDSKRHFSLPLPLTHISSCVSAHPDVADYLAHSNGVTFVRYDLKDGAVTETAIRESSGNTVLDGYALSCVKDWRFKPQYDSGARATGHHLAIIDWGQHALR